jgi:tRNA (mo5U34)-methyltransferase
VSADLAGEIAGQTWYHTIEVAPGVVTPGYFDTRAAARELPMPASLAGARCLDIGTYDGFWAFEMERRGAAEVVAVDVLDPGRWDWPGDTEAATRAEMGERKRGSRGFELAHAALGSRVERRDLSVYELAANELGEFDFVYCGSLLLHLRDPVGALMRIHDVCRGALLLEDVIDLGLTLRFPRRPVAGLDGRGRPWWWRANVAGLRRMAEAAGFTLTAGPSRFYMPFGAGGPATRVHPRALWSHAAREQAIYALRGDPHAALLGVRRR